jgi:hypothetical protein
MLPIYLAPKEARSCDDLSNNTSRTTGPQPHYQQSVSQTKANTSGKRRQNQSRHQPSNRSMGTSGTKSIDMPPRFNATSHNNQNSYAAGYRPKNILDMLPPPPVHPPPPSTPGSIHNHKLQQNNQSQQYQGHALSQESVISPKYLFQHPAYRGSTRQSALPNASSNKLYRVRPATANQYEDPRLMIPREAFYAPTSAKPVNNQNVHQHNQREENNIMSTKRSNVRNNDFDNDFQNELQSFHEAVTQFVSSSNEGCNVPYSEKFNLYMSSEAPSNKRRLQKDNTLNSQLCEPEFCVDDGEEDADYDEEERLSSNFDPNQESDASSSDNECKTVSQN